MGTTANPAIGLLGEDNPPRTLMFHQARVRRVPNDQLAASKGGPTMTWSSLGPVWLEPLRVLISRQAALGLDGQARCSCPLGGLAAGPPCLRNINEEDESVFLTSLLAQRFPREHIAPNAFYRFKAPTDPAICAGPGRPPQCWQLGRTSEDLARSLIRAISPNTERPFSPAL